MKIDIPTIYEEDIIGVVHQNGNLIFEYASEHIVKIIFQYVYKYDFVEFDYINEIDWTFGLELQRDSTYIKDLTGMMEEEKLKRAFGGEYDKLQHYRLVIDDVGIYNIVCKGMKLDLNAKGD